MTFSKINHSYIYLFGLALLVIGLPFSNFLMSVSQFVLIGNWLVEGGIKNKLRGFGNNKTALIISSVFVIHLLGLLYTSDLNYGLEDIRKKVPLFLLPLIIATSKPLPDIWFKRLLAIFVTSVFLATIVSSFVLFGFIGDQVIDVRQISLFISHIRFSLMICLSFFITVYYAFQQKGWLRVLAVLTPLWLALFLGLMESLTGIIVLALVSFILLVYKTLHLKSMRRKIACLALLLLMPLSLFFYINSQVKAFYHINPVDFSGLEEFSAKGERYIHNTTSHAVENGNYIWVYIAWDELEESWNKKSAIPFDGVDKKEQPIRYTILRFLSSKGLRKDMEGVNSLSDSEIRSIERGIANVDYQDVFSLPDRIRQIIWEIDACLKGENPNGHSLTMRLEFWKAAIGIIKENPLLGIGTGDVKTAFDAQYKKMNSPLNPQWRLRAHNQFLEITIALGLIGLLFFLFSLIYPFLSFGRNIDYFYAAFFIIAVFSMFSEDTLETQAGITFFAFFNSFFLFARQNSRMH